MLTGDLVAVRRPKGERGKVVPAFVDPEDAGLLELSESVVRCFREAAEGRWRRAELDAALETVLAERRDLRRARGLCKVALDRSELVVTAAVDPVELRSRVFARAAATGPLALVTGPLGRRTAADVLSEVAAELARPLEEVEASLYADLHEEQRIVEARIPSASWLLARYNVALVQAVLLKAYSVEIRLEGASTPRARQLFRQVRFHQLLHRVTASRGALTIHLDGPMSLFRQSTRYGLELARFFPALPLQTTPWTLSAEVKLGRAHERMEVSSRDGLVSHYRDTGAYETREAQWFRERFDALDTAWKLDAEPQPLTLPGGDLLLPDFTLRRGDRTAHLEIAGFWRKEWLARRIDVLRDHGPGNLILAVSKKLACDAEKLAGTSGIEVVPFSEVVPAKAVVEAAERVAR